MKRGVRYGSVTAAMAVLLTTCVSSPAIGEGAFGGARSTSSAGRASNGATFVYAVPAMPATLDYVPYTDPSRYVDTPLESTLVSYNPAKLPDRGCNGLAPLSDITGDLATSWTYSANRKTITFHLGNAVSQYGNPLTAADVKWSLDRTIALSPVSQFNYFTTAHYRPKDTVTIVNSKTVQLHVEKPTALDVANLTMFFSMIYDAAEAQKHATPKDPWAQKWLSTHTDSFGPWEVSSFKPLQSVTFVRNPYYTGKRGNITKLIIEAVPSASTRATLLKAGSVDWAADLSFNEYKGLEHASGVTVQQCDSPNRDDLVLNMAKDKRFANIRVREAISLALNRKAIVQGAYFGFGKPAITGLSQYYQFKMPTNAAGRYRYDPQEAKKLLAEAGYPHGFSMSLLYSPTRPGPWSAQSAVIVQSELQQIGIDAVLKEEASGTTFSTDFRGGNFDAVMWEEPPLIADPYFSAVIFNFSKSFQNHFGFDSASYDALVTATGLTAPGPRRQKLLTALAAAGVEQYPVIYLVDDVYLNAYRSNISGYEAYPSGDLYPSEYTKS